MKRKKPRIVLVAWRDAHQINGSWTAPEDVKPTDQGINHSVGWLVKRDDKWLYIALDFEPTAGNFAGVGAIPSANVISLKTLSA